MIKTLLAIIVAGSLSIVAAAAEHPEDSSTETRDNPENESGGSFLEWLKNNSTPVYPMGFDDDGGSGNGGGSGGGDGGGGGGHG